LTLPYKIKIFRYQTIEVILINNKTYLPDNYWVQTWLLLHKEEKTRKNMKNGYKFLETTTMEIFAKFAWKFSKLYAYTSVISSTWAITWKIDRGLPS